MKKLFLMGASSRYFYNQLSFSPKVWVWAEELKVYLYFCNDWIHSLSPLVTDTQDANQNRSLSEYPCFPYNPQNVLRRDLWEMQSYLQSFGEFPWRCTTCTPAWKLEKEGGPKQSFFIFQEESNFSQKHSPEISLYELLRLLSNPSFGCLESAVRSQNQQVQRSCRRHVYKSPTWFLRQGWPLFLV